MIEFFSNLCLMQHVRVAEPLAFHHSGHINRLERQGPEVSHLDTNFCCLFEGWVSTPFVEQV